MARPNIRLLIPLVLAVGGGVWGFNRWSFAEAHESTDNAQVDGHIVPVVAKVGGFVLAVSVGDNVHVDDRSVLVTIDPREYDVRLAQAEADYAAARGAYLARFPDSEPMFGFGDFSLFLVEPSAVRGVAGFGQAWSLTGPQYRQFMAGTADE